jgi:hypothetical protein
VDLADCVGFLFIASGQIWIKCNGKADPKGRFLIANHTAMIGPFERATTSNDRRRRVRNNAAHEARMGAPSTDLDQQIRADRDCQEVRRRRKRPKSWPKGQ